MKRLKNSVSLFNHISKQSKVLVFYRTDSEFCSMVEKKFRSYVDSSYSALSSIGVSFVIFTVDAINCSDVEVIKVPQFRYFVDGNEIGSFIGDFELQDFLDIIGLQ